MQPRQRKVHRVEIFRFQRFLQNVSRLPSFPDGRISRRPLHVSARIDTLLRRAGIQGEPDEADRGE
jgi:hypothetical protein